MARGAALALACAIALGLTSALSSASWAADLTEVRVGRHPDKTRVVLEVDGPFQHRVREGRREIVVEVSADSPIRTIPAKGDQLRTVQVAPSADGAEVRLVLRNDVSLKSFTLKGPDRLVLDLFPATAATATAAAKPKPAPKPEPKAAPAPAPTPSKPAPSAQAAAPEPAPVTPPPEPKPTPVAEAPKPTLVAEAPKPEPKADSPSDATRIQIPLGASGPESEPESEGGLPASAGATRPVEPAPDEPDRLPDDALEWEDLADAEPATEEAPDAPVEPPAAMAEAIPSGAVDPGAAPGAQEGPGQGIPRSTLFIGGILLALVGGGVALMGIRRRQAEAEDVSPTAFLDDLSPDESKATQEVAPEPVEAEAVEAAAEDAIDAQVEPADIVPEPTPATPEVDVTSTAPWPATAATEPAGDLETTAATPIPETTPSPDPVADAQTSIFDTATPAAAASEPITPEEIAVNEIPPTETESAKPDLAATMVSPSAPPPAPSVGGDASRFEELERRMALLETRLEEVVDAKERLERQVVAQTEELRVQRAAIARTQRVLRGMARPEDEATEPAPKT